MKKFICVLLSACLITSLFIFNTSAANTDTDMLSNILSQEVEVDPAYDTGIELYSNYQILNDTIIDTGREWLQPYGYSSYRVWVENTTNEEMTVTISSDGGTFTKTVAANSNRVILIVNNAVHGTHSVDFTTPSGTVSGTIRVRVSDTPLSY